MGVPVAVRIDHVGEECIAGGDPQPRAAQPRRAAARSGRRMWRPRPQTTARPSRSTRARRWRPHGRRRTSHRSGRDCAKIASKKVPFLLGGLDWRRNRHPPCSKSTFRGCASVRHRQKTVDRGLASEAFAEAGAIARSAGLKVRESAALRRSQAVRDRCGPSVRTPILDDAVAPVALTPREREVVELAARGLSNADIAGKLFVSLRTAEGHLPRPLRQARRVRSGGVARRTRRRRSPTRFQLVSSKAGVHGAWTSPTSSPPLSPLRPSRCRDNLQPDGCRICSCG